MIDFQGILSQYVRIYNIRIRGGCISAKVYFEISFYSNWNTFLLHHVFYWTVHCGSRISVSLIKVLAINRETPSELYKPLQDSLIKRCLEIIDLDKKHDSQSSAILKAKGVWSKVFPKPRRCWLPTGCLVRNCLAFYFIYFITQQVCGNDVVFEHPETAWSFTWSATKDVFNCFRL